MLSLLQTCAFFGEQGPSAFVTNTVCFNCFLCLSQLSAPNGVRVGSGGAHGRFASLHLLKCSQAGEGHRPGPHLGKPVALTKTRHVPAPPQKSHTSFSFTLFRCWKRYRQVETEPLTRSLTQEAIIASQVVQNLFMILTRVKQEGRM